MAIYCILMILAVSQPASDSATVVCDETVVIDSVVYRVPIAWCGRAIDSTLMARPAQLARLPEKLCFQDYRIYVTRETRDAFVVMAAAAKSLGVDLRAKSGYRSARYQRQIFRRRMTSGQRFEDIANGIAPPGYSEHETGRVLDLSTVNPPYQQSEVYQWLVANAHRYGFHETYPAVNSSDTHPWEPWHWVWRKVE